MLDSVKSKLKLRSRAKLKAGSRSVHCFEVSPKPDYAISPQRLRFSDFIKSYAFMALRNMSRNQGPLRVLDPLSLRLSLSTPPPSPPAPLPVAVLISVLTLLPITSSMNPKAPLVSLIGNFRAP